MPIIINKLTRYSWIATALILLIGFIFLHFGLVNYSSTFFTIFPLAVGFSIGTLENLKQRNAGVIIFGLLVFLGLLLASALEGLICVLMAAPIFALFMLIGYNVQRYFKRKTNNKVVITLMPLVILLIFDPIEEMIVPEPITEVITSSILLDYPADVVFDEVKEMDKLDARRPIGMVLGLPSPYRCELAADTVGALRVCLFSNGEIIAKITRYQHGEVLEMDVIDYTLTGRDWFEFVDATYTFEEENGKTRITRTSSYKSILNPRLYWRPLEHWGIQQEHTFVLNSLKKNLSERTIN